MLREHSRTAGALLRLLDLLLLAAAWPLAHAALRWSGGAPASPFLPGGLPPGAVITVVAWVGISTLLGLYARSRRERLRLELEVIARAVGLVALVALSTAHLFPVAATPGPLVILAVFGLAALLISASRVGLRQLAYAIRRQGYNTRYFTVVGSGEHAEQLVERIAERPEWGYAFLGYVRQDDAPAEADDAPVLGRLGDLARLLTDHVIDEVYFAVPHHQLAAIEPSIRLCQEQGIRASVSLGAFGELQSHMTVVETGGQPMLTFIATPTGVAALTAKRAFDVLASGVMLILLAPLFAIIALATRLDSPGPGFFRQRRVGLNGREFTFYKFRSMRVGAEAELAQLRAQNEMDGPVFKMARDPRITRLGAFLRKTSLDELPQFWNVFCGEMSLVGPRPPLPAEVRQYLPWQRRRLSVKPGITCTWQVSGRNEIDFDQWMRLDLAYIDRWSFWRDIGICLQTVPAVLFARGAR